MALYFSDGWDYFCSLIMKMLNFDPGGIWWGAAPENRQYSCSVIHYIIGLGWMRKKQLSIIFYLLVKMAAQQGNLAVILKSNLHPFSIYSL